MKTRRNEKQAGHGVNVFAAIRGVVEYPLPADFDVGWRKEARGDTPMIRQCLIALGLGLAACGAAAAEDVATTPEAVVAKVQEAAAHLAKEGEAGLTIFEAENSPFVWGGTYVFAFDCANDVIVAHPVAASRGVNISTLEDPNGKFYGKPLCDAAEVAGGSWADYVWPKPVAGADGGLVYSDEAFRKVTYMLSVEGQPYQVGAGIYDETTSLDDLNAMVAK